MLLSSLAYFFEPTLNVQNMGSSEGMYESLLLTWWQATKTVSTVLWKL